MGDPYPSELVHAADFEQLVAGLCARPQMYVTPATFGAACAFLSGFDAARSGGPLIGLHPWLVVRVGDGNNLHWSGLARRQLPAAADLSGEEGEVRALGRLLGEFFEYRRANGVTRLFADYAAWLLTQEWYRGPLRPD